VQGYPCIIQFLSSL